MTSLHELATLWPPEERSTAVAVALAESGGRLDALCDSCLGVAEVSAGPWQVNVLAWPQFDVNRLRSDPWYAARAAYHVWQVQGWHAWSAYTSGAYLRFLGDAGTQELVAAPASPSAPEAVRSLLPVAALALVALWLGGYL